MSQTGGTLDLKELARILYADESVDISDFQRRARVLQSLWRGEQGIEPGEHRGRPLGSRLPMPRAQEALDNFLTETIREVVLEEVCNPDASADKLYSKPRIFNDLLSSQPLCFNLFGELTRDLALSSKIVANLTEGRFTEVTAIEFEWSPGRRDPRYLNDRSAFDVLINCRDATGNPCFVGIEVKYHENLLGKAGENKLRYDEVADLMGCFQGRQDRALLKASPLQQIWRDHLLAGITLIEDKDKYADALFVTLYPRENKHVSEALEDYTQQLVNSHTFAQWTLEDFVAAIRGSSNAEWIDCFVDRYLAFEKIDRKLDLSG